MKTISIFLCLCTFAVANPGCIEKKPVYDDLEINYDPEALKYVQLTVGKYLIYKDSATGTLDSVVVTRSEKAKKYEPAVYGTLAAHAGYYMEEYTLILTKMNPTALTWFYGKTVDPRLGTYTVSTNSEFMDMRDNNNQTVFGYPTCFCTYTPVVLPSVIVEGRTFNNVVKLNSSNGFAPGNPSYKSTVYYWAQGFGIIKIQKEEAAGKSSFTLLRNN